MSIFAFVSGWALRQAPGKGLAQYEFCRETGEMKLVALLEDTEVFNVTCIDDVNQVLYALCEERDLPGSRAGGGGRIFTFKLEPLTGKVYKLGVTPTHCPNPTHISLSPDRKHIVVTNHGTKNYITQIVQGEDGTYRACVSFDDSAVELFSLNEAGVPDKILDVSVHKGCGPTPRQTSAHAHCASLAPSGKFYIVLDKGSDRIYTYTADMCNGTLCAMDHPYQMPPGAMPRYCVFHPTFPVFYVICEGVMDVYAFRYSEAGEITPFCVQSVLTPDHVVPEKTVYEQQAICIHPSGRFLYVASNGPDTVTVFDLAEEDGALKQLQTVAVGCAWPRGAALSPCGNYLVVGCTKGQKLIVFRVNADGSLTKLENEYNCQSASYITFWSVPG